MEYDVALSFAGENREYVEEVANELRHLGVSVFYDNFEIAKLWGKDLYTHLQDVYQKQAKYTVIFISEHYAKKLWTNHERKMAQARAFTESREYILPARFDDTEIEGIPLTTAYIDLRLFSPKEFSALICKKIKSELPDEEGRQIEAVSEKVLSVKALTQRVTSLSFIVESKKGLQKEEDVEQIIKKLIKRYLPTKQTSFSVQKITDGLLVDIKFDPPYYSSHIEIFKGYITKEIGEILARWSPSFK